MREISEEIGQLPSRNPVDASPVKSPLNFGGSIAQDADGNWYTVRQ